MTSPVDALSETQHHVHGAGRLYGPSGFDASQLRTDQDTVAALREGTLYPSVTNVIGMLPKPHLTGWYGREAIKTFAATSEAVNTARVTALQDALARGVDPRVVVDCAASTIPTTLIPTITDGKSLATATRKGQAWVKAVSDVLAGRYPIEYLRDTLDGKKPTAAKQRALYARFMDGELTAVELDDAQMDLQNSVICLLREHEHGHWVYARIATDQKGVALHGEAASRNRDAAADYGTIVHDLVEKMCLSENPLAGYTGEYGYHVRGFQAWWKAASPTDITPELTVRGTTPEGLAFAGTADLFCRIDGVGTVADWKTSRSLDEGSVALQVSAIAHADTVPFPIEQGFGVHLPRKEDADKALRFARPGDGYETYRQGYRAYEVDAAGLVEGWETFCAARALWQRKYVSPSPV